jgi:hypothetical protein
MEPESRPEPVPAQAQVRIEMIANEHIHVIRPEHWDPNQVHAFAYAISPPTEEEGQSLALLTNLCDRFMQDGLTRLPNSIENSKVFITYLIKNIDSYPEAFSRDFLTNTLLKYPELIGFTKTIVEQAGSQINQNTRKEILEGLHTIQKNLEITAEELLSDLLEDLQNNRKSTCGEKIRSLKENHAKEIMELLIPSINQSNKKHVEYIFYRILWARKVYLMEPTLQLIETKCPTFAKDALLALAIDVQNNGPTIL